MLHGINRIHGRPCHPQTQGKEERFYKTRKVELKAKRLRVAKALVGRMGALRPRGEQLWEMCFASTLIGIYDLSEIPPGLVVIRPQQIKRYPCLRTGLSHVSGLYMLRPLRGRGLILSLRPSS